MAAGVARLSGAGAPLSAFWTSDTFVLLVLPVELFRRDHPRRSLRVTSSW